MESQRQQYIPGPPPPPQQQQQASGFHIPPPPPRPQYQTHTLPPPPVAPHPSALPPGTVYGFPPGWQQSWARPGMGQSLPPPPPLTQAQIQNQMRYGSASGQGGINMPPAQPQYEVSATFIPGGDSFGPGVGIPPFEDYSSSSYSNFDYLYSGQPPLHLHDTSTMRENRSTSAASNRGNTLTLAFRESSPVSPGPPTATLRNPQPAQNDKTVLPSSSRQRAHSTAIGPGGNDMASQWPLERVLVWLAANNFTPEWQETFRLLRIGGADFLELGRGGRAFSSKMYPEILPRLAQVCTSSKLGWDQAREREEARRLRRLLGRLVDGSDTPASAGPGHRRRESTLIPSASTEGNVEGSPHLTTSGLITTPSTAGADESPGRQPPPSLASNFGPRGSHGRSSTMPVYSKQTSSASTPSDNRHPDSFNNRSEYRTVLNGLNTRGRHSPGISGDGALGLGLRQIDASPNGSPQPGYAQPTPATSAPNNLANRPDHSKNNSIGSTNSIRLANTSNPSISSLGAGRFYENQNRQAQEQNRPSPLENNRSYSNDGHIRDHSKGLFSRLKFSKKSEAHDHDTTAVESPTSPNSFRQMLPGSSGRGVGSGESMTAPRPGSGYDAERKSGNVRRKFIFVTPDHWNYRLIDVTEIETAVALRSLICIDLGVPDAEYAEFFLTEPGQTDHDEPLTDASLVAARAQADSLGLMKFFVQSPNLSAISAPQNNMYGLGFTRNGNSEPMVKSSSASGVNSDGIGSDSASKEALQKAADQWRRDAERKQQEYQDSRRMRKDETQAPGIRSSRFIDFDSPRPSPYEDKKMSDLVPMRRPPAAPSESSTLTKVNSLRKPGEKNRTSMDALKRISDPITEEKSRKRMSGGSSPASGIGAALANVGKLAGTPATAGSSQRGTMSMSQGGSSSPEFTWSKGNMLFKVPSYNAPSQQRPQTDSRTGQAQIPAIQKLQKREPSPVSPSTESSQRPALPRVQSVGPDLEFKETNVAFFASPNPQPHDDSDDDSDDGLFAIPLTVKGGRPTLKVDTDSQAPKPPLVHFKTPSSANGPSLRPDLEPDSGLSFDDGPLSASSVDRPPRPDSFISDIWANRPAVENVVDHLDQFFPGVDLDKPYLEEGADNMSPAQSAQSDGSATLRDRMGFHSDAIPIDFSHRSESDTLGSDESTLKESNKSKVKNVAQRQISKAGNGLGRMKSVREVAKRRNEMARGHSVVRTQAQRETNLLRRKSTKMFGAHIVQIKPQPGNRLSTLEPILQEEQPTDDTPKRQATFKIIRGNLIGKGTYGRVYLGMNATTGEFLAVKQVEVNQKAAGQDRDRIKEMVAALDQEIDTMQHLEHPNIVQYLGCERKEFSISIYLEYIPGGSIGSCLRKHGKFEEPVVRSLTQQTLRGLAYLHQEGILHRDLKADNILLDLDGTCKISDFGISKKSDNIYGDDITNSMQGSVFWMAPEVVRAQGQGYSAKVDIWSLGCVVLEMFAGKRPWSRDEAIGAIFKLGKLNLAPPIPEEVASTASVDGLNFMYDCFQVNPSDRPTAETLLRHSTFCISDPYYNFYDTNLAAKLRTSDIAPTGL